MMSIQKQFHIIAHHLSSRSQFVWTRIKYFLKLEQNPFVAIKPYCCTTPNRHYWDQASFLWSTFARREVNTFTLELGNLLFTSTCPSVGGWRVQTIGTCSLWKIYQKTEIKSRKLFFLGSKAKCSQFCLIFL